MSVKIERLNNIFVEQISRILKTEIKDERIHFVTVTAVKITNDLSFAKVYVTILDDQEKNSMLKLLNKLVTLLKESYLNVLILERCQILVLSMTIQLLMLII